MKQAKKKQEKLEKYSKTDNFEVIDLSAFLIYTA